jgi:hypothetical protein
MYCHIFSQQTTSLSLRSNCSDKTGKQIRNVFVSSFVPTVIVGDHDVERNEGKRA